MAININVESDADTMATHIQTAGQDYMFATAVALTKLAVKVRENNRAYMAKVFDAPRPYTLNGFMVRPATKANPVAIIMHKSRAGADPDADAGKTPNQYLETQATGGVGVLTALELGFTSSHPGLLTSLVPAKGARVDRYGNWSSSERGAVLKSLRAVGPAKPGRKKRTEPGGYFILGDDTGHRPGVYTNKVGGGLRKVLAFISWMPNYTKRFLFEEEGTRFALANYRTVFAAELARIKVGQRTPTTTPVVTNP